MSSSHFRASYLPLIFLLTNQNIQLIADTLSSNQNRVDHRKWNFNSLLPVGKYIDMDPSTTELVISHTQFIRSGQCLLGCICDNQRHFHGGIIAAGAPVFRLSKDLRKKVPTSIFPM